MNRFRNILEWQFFGVCTMLGQHLGIAISKIRLWFIYVSFATFGSPVIIYFIVSFLMNIKHYVLLRKRNVLTE